MNRPVVVSDAGPLIALACCRHLYLLEAVFESVHVPQAVLAEIYEDRLRPDVAEIEAFVTQHALVHENRADEIYNSMVGHLDEGEAQALSIAHALGCGVLMDERRGRLAAARLGLPVFGVLGVLLQAKRVGIIDKIAPVLANIQENGYRFSRKLIDTALKHAGEDQAT